jgi:hypothetical protein
VRGSLEVSGASAADRRGLVEGRLSDHIAEAQGTKEYRGPYLRSRDWTGG